MTDNRNEITYRYGVALDLQTAQLWALLIARFPGLIITQGVRSGAAASGNTHRGLGVLDFYLGRHASQRTAVLKYAFEIGLFGWYRPELWRGTGRNRYRVWKSHVHLGVRGNAKMDPSLKAQQISWTNRRNGLVGNGPDAFTWRPANYKKAAPYKVDKPKVTKLARAWANDGFLNTHWNSVAGGKEANVIKTAPKFAKIATAGGVGFAAFSEVRGSQRKYLDAAMAKRGFRRIADNDGNMLIAYARKSTEVLGVSFDTFDAQDGGNVEGVLRFRLRVGGSLHNVGIVHLDWDSSDAKKRSNILETYESMKRWGSTLPSDWKGRTVIIGDWNKKGAFVEDILKSKGFKKLSGSTGFDQAFVGATRADRGGKATKVDSDHPHLRVRIGRK